MDGTLGSQTARMLDGSGVEITSGEQLADIVTRAAAAGWPVAVHAIGDLANREALDAFERTQEHWRPRGLRPRIEHAQCVAEEDLPRFAALGVADLGPVQPRPLRPRPRRALLAGAARRHVRVPHACRLRRARRERLRRADRGARSVGRCLRRRPAHARRSPRLATRARRVTVEQALARDDRRAGVALGRRAKAREAPARLLRRPRRARPRSARVRSGRPARRSRRGDDGRRPLGAQPAALGLAR